MLERADARDKLEVEDEHLLEEEIQEWLETNLEVEITDLFHGVSAPLSSCCGVCVGVGVCVRVVLCRVYMCFVGVVLPLQSYLDNITFSSFF